MGMALELLLLAAAAAGVISAADPAAGNTAWDRRLEARLLADRDWLLRDGGLQGAAEGQQGRQQQEHLKGTAALVRASGYPVERHTARTDDGFLLTVFRIPRPGRPAVFLMHGILSSSADFVFLGKGRALALLLHDAGYDVWMGNARGTTESRRHERLRPDQAAFWDFSWHEIGTLDVPACVDLVLRRTRQSALHYVGHSQGTTTFFVLGSERPEYMAKVKTFTALAPVAFVRDIRSPLVRIMALAPNTLAFVLELVGVNEFLPSTRLLSWLGDEFCADDRLTQPLCYNLMFLVAGSDRAELNTTALPQLLTNAPAGASTKQFLHYGQNVHRRRLGFTKFDHGWLGNLAEYGRLQPPDYNLTSLTVPTHLVYSSNDVFCVHTNVVELIRVLPSLASVRRVPFAQFSHLDFLIAEDAKELVYDNVIDIITEFETK